MPKPLLVRCSESLLDSFTIYGWMRLPAGTKVRNARRKPPQYDTSATVARIFADVCETATALRTTAEREEDRIYTHYEGWLPDEEKLPTTEWQKAWCETNLLRNSRPATSLATPLPTGAPNDPVYDDSDPATAARTVARSQQCY